MLSQLNDLQRRGGLGGKDLLQLRRQQRGQFQVRQLQWKEAVDKFLKKYHNPQQTSKMLSAVKTLIQHKFRSCFSANA